MTPRKLPADVALPSHPVQCVHLLGDMALRRRGVDEFGMFLNTGVKLEESVIYGSLANGLVFIRRLVVHWDSQWGGESLDLRAQKCEFQVKDRGGWSGGHCGL